MDTVALKDIGVHKIIAELDRSIIGQADAKRAVALALRNRWRRLRLDAEARREILPKNILMVGPTGVGKTEIARRLAALADSPFIKVEATKYTEVGYVGRDVEQIIRDLVERAITMVRDKAREKIRAKAIAKAEERLILALVGEQASEETKDRFLRMLRQGELDGRDVTIDMRESRAPPMASMDVPGMPGAQMGMLNLNDVFGKMFGEQSTKKTIPVAKARQYLEDEEAGKMLDNDALTRAAMLSVEQNGIVFIDEIDKICVHSSRSSGEVSREGVQRDLLPLIEGTAVSTRHGIVRTDHILFIASGAFHASKPSDLMPELQGRLPVRVELLPLTRDDFIAILTEPRYSLTRQYQLLIETEGVRLRFSAKAVKEIASLSVKINENMENIGARRLHTVLEKVLEEISFKAGSDDVKEYRVTDKHVREKIGDLLEKGDLSRFIL